MESKNVATTENPALNKADVSSSHKEKDFVQWLTEDALPTTKDILAELKSINAKRDEAKTWLRENNIEVTEEAIQERISGCC